MKKTLLTSAFFIFAIGNIFSQIVGSLQLTTSVTVATVCTAPCNGTANVKAAGGTPPYTYNWSTSPTQTNATATGLCPGTYSVIVNDASPSAPNYAVATVTITCSNGTPTGLTLSTTVTAANTCLAPCDGAASVTASGGTPPYTYGWSSIPAQTTQNATGLCPGTYTVMVRDATSPTPNQAYATVTVTCSGISTGAITVATSATPATVCVAPCNGTATANPTSGTPPYFYTWSTSPVQTTQTATGLCPGTYSVNVTDSGTPSPGQGKGSVTVVCNTVNGIDDISLDENITLFPNPAHSHLNVLFNAGMEGKMLISVTGILGTEILRDAFDVKGEYTRSVDISSLPEGIYCIEIRSENAVLTKQFIKQ